MKETEHEEVSNQKEVLFNGRLIRVKAEKTTNAFVVVSQLEEKLKNTDKGEPKIGLSICQDLINALQEVHVLVSKEKKEQSVKSEATGTFYNGLLKQINLRKLELTRDRALTMADLITKRQNSATKSLGLTNVKLIGDIRPQNILKFLLKALKAQ